MKALIIEKDPTTTKLLQILLSHYYDVSSTKTGEEGVEEFARITEAGKHFAVVYIDAFTTGDKSQETLDEIRNLDAEKKLHGLGRSKIIVMHSADNKEAVQKHYREKCDGFLQKPFDKDALTKQLNILGLLESNKLTKVLIAEDDSTSRTLLKVILKQMGYEPIVTTNGNDALEVLQSDTAPKLAILDWMMPGIDGVDVCREIRKKITLNPTYIIMLTAKGQKDDVVVGLNAGADDYITKPFDKAELTARIMVGEKVVDLQVRLSDRINKLQDAMKHIRRLQGILPICMYCHKIRTDDDSWAKIDSYLENNTDAHLSHGICPDCKRKHFPDFEEKDEK